MDAATPELAVGVLLTWRGRGVGSRLLTALAATAYEHGLTALSLSVEPDNDARRLYERIGFYRVGDLDGSLTMLLRLPVPSPCTQAVESSRSPGGGSGGCSQA